MKKLLFLSSALIMTSFGAFGADGTITSGENTCTIDVLGVSDNNATANTIATWTLNKYNLTPGQYLNVTDTDVAAATCPAGSYCVGGEYTVENASGSMSTCPTDYPSSDAGAGAQTQCYTACTVANANIAHATAVSGNDYFGTDTNTCIATSCDTGYHVDGEITIVEKEPLIPANYTIAGDGYAYIRADGNSSNYSLFDAGLTENNTWATHFNYGTVYGKASCQPQTHPEYGYIIANADAVIDDSMTMEELKTGLEPMVGTSKANFVVDILTSVINGTKSKIDMYEALWVVFMTEPDANYSTDSSGQYCYCQMDGFKPTSGDRLSVISAPWVFDADYGSVNLCESECTSGCAFFLRLSDVKARAFRAAVYGAFSYTETGICAANTINIDWNPDNGSDVIQNQCAYDGAVTLPSDPVKPGYTFTGWKLIESTTTE